MEDDWSEANIYTQPPNFVHPLQLKRKLLISGSRIDDDSMLMKIIEKVTSTLQKTLPPLNNTPSVPSQRRPERKAVSKLVIRSPQSQFNIPKKVKWNVPESDSLTPPLKASQTHGQA